MTDNRPLLSVQEVAEMLCVPVRWFYGSKAEPAPALKAGLKMKKIGGYLRVRPSDLEDYLATTDIDLKELC